MPMSRLLFFFSIKRLKQSWLSFDLLIYPLPPLNLSLREPSRDLSSWLVSTESSNLGAEGLLHHLSHCLDPCSLSLTWLTSMLVSQLSGRTAVRSFAPSRVEMMPFWSTLRIMVASTKYISPFLSTAIPVSAETDCQEWKVFLRCFSWPRFPLAAFFVTPDS